MCVPLSNGVACPKATTLVGVALSNVCIASSGKGRSPAQGVARSAGVGVRGRDRLSVAPSGTLPFRCACF